MWDRAGCHGSSGKDSASLQIAKAPGHGTVYATPHYLDGYTVYCLEHTLPGPGENISGGGQQPTGPYVIVDMDSYRTNPGYSSIIYHESTLHAIGWVLRHTYPFMVIDDDDPDNETWSRVAGQFAIRQVIRELEGPQYVRDYWNMDNFYRASGQAPGVYLEYARWLAANGIARASMTGAISVSNQSTRFSGGSLTGTVTFTTDADLIRVSRSYGVLTGNTAGQDESYYYLNSGDTVSITAPGTHLSFVAESVSVRRGGGELSGRRTGRGHPEGAHPAVRRALQAPVHDRHLRYAPGRGSRRRDVRLHRRAAGGRGV